MSLEIVLSLADWARRFPPPARSVVAIGNFDGLHLGHQRILRRVVIRAVALDALAAVVTFDPHPMKILRPDAAPPLITTLEQRLSAFDESALDAALVLPFTEEISRVSAEDFVRNILVQHLRVRAVLVGKNFRFGHKHAGDVRLLKELGKSGEAKGAYEKALAQDSTNVSAINNLGNAEYALGQINRATELYQKALRIDPKNQEALYNLGVSFADAQIYKQALDYWRRLVAIDSTTTVAQSAKNSIQVLTDFLSQQKTGTPTQQPAPSQH